MNLPQFVLRTLVISLTLLFVSKRGACQQAPGLYLENYSGIHGVLKNPAFGQHGNLGWDINLGSLNFNLDNDYAYAANSNFFHFIQRRDSLTILGENEQVVNPEEFGISFNPENSDKYGYAHMDVVGPSAWIELHPVSFGLFTRLRSDMGIAKIPATIGYNQYQNLNLDEFQSLESIQSAGAIWSEYGINISSNAFWSKDLSAGINIKYLVGHEGYFLSTPNTLNFSKTSDNQLLINNAVASLGFTSGIGDFSQINSTKKGTGWAIDLGYSQTFERSRIAVSLLDLGQISFDNSSELHQVVVNDTLILVNNDINSQNSFSGLIGLIGDNLQTDSTIIADNFDIKTPVRFMINYNYRFAQNFYINASLVQNLSTSDNAIKSQNTVAFSPRYETRWMTITSPIIINNYKNLKVGIAARLGFLTIGSDNLLSLFGKRDLYGSSVYAALKINPFKYGGKKGRGVNCPKVKRSPWDSAKPIKGAKRMSSPG